MTMRWYYGVNPWLHRCRVLDDIARWAYGGQLLPLVVVAVITFVP